MLSHKVILETIVEFCQPFVSLVIEPSKVGGGGADMLLVMIETNI
jgi:hypothetical protein